MTTKTFSMPIHGHTRPDLKNVSRKKRNKKKSQQALEFTDFDVLCYVETFFPPSTPVIYGRM
jgi:hypothetical protein